MEHIILSGVVGAGYGCLTGDVGSMITIMKLGMAFIAFSNKSRNMC